MQRTWGFISEGIDLLPNKVKPQSRGVTIQCDRDEARRMFTAVNHRRGGGMRVEFPISR